MTERKLSRTLTARVTEDLYKRVQVFCAMEGLSVQTLVTDAVVTFIDRHEATAKRRQSRPPEQG